MVARTNSAAAVTSSLVAVYPEADLIDEIYGEQAVALVRGFGYEPGLERPKAFFKSHRPMPFRALRGASFNFNRFG